jgi:hypothetical protein
MCEANVDAPSHVAKASTITHMTAPLHGIAYKRVSIGRHRVVMTSRRCDVPRGSSHVRVRGSWHLICSPSPRRLFRQETSYGHHGVSSGTRALSWKACERWGVLLEEYNWPGNIRELQNFIERSVILTTGPELRSPVTDLTNFPLPDGNGRTLADADKAHITATLRQTNWVIGGQNGAAERLGLKRTTLIAKMRRLGLSMDTADQRARQSDSYVEAPPHSLWGPA